MRNGPTLHRTGLVALRVVAILAGIVGAVYSTVALLDRTAIEDPVITLTMAKDMPEIIEISHGMDGRGPNPILILGDSTVIYYPPGHQVPDRLEQALAGGSANAPTKCFSLAVYGFSHFEYYPFADRIAAVQPEAIVMGFNLQWLSPDWQSSKFRPEVLGWLPIGELPATLTLPLHWWSVTIDQMLLYTALIKARAVEPWYRYRLEQVRTGKGIDLIRISLQDSVKHFAGGSEWMPHGLPPKPLRRNKDRPDRFSPDWVDRLFSPALMGVDPTHPSLQTFAALLRRFDRRDIPVIVYITPTNVDYMRSIGRVDDRKLARTIDAIGTIVNDNGGVLVDLHDLLPDSAFIDAAGHFTHEGEYDGPSLIATHLAPVILQQLTPEPSARGVVRR